MKYDWKKALWMKVLGVEWGFEDLTLLVGDVEHESVWTEGDADV